MNLKLMPRKRRLLLTNKESEALICILDNLLAGSGMKVADADTFEAAARILIKHRGYATIDGTTVTEPGKIWGAVKV